MIVKGIRTLSFCKKLKGITDIVLIDLFKPRRTIYTGTRTGPTIDYTLNQISKKSIMETKTN